MISVEEKERIRRAHFVEGKSLRAIEREQRHSRRTIKKALVNAEAERYRLSAPRASPVLGPWHARIDELLAERNQQPRKQRYTKHKIFEVLKAEGYTGSESGVAVYVWKRWREQKRPEVFLPLAWDPGQDAQVDWGEAQVELDGELTTVQFFEMRACYSRKPFVRVYPTQKQESFFDGHVEAFKFFGGVFARITYDNLKAAVAQVLQGKTRRQQRAFVAFRSHYLFEPRFCTPGEGHEKGGVENGIGYARRNFFTPILKAKSFDDLNAQVLRLCHQEDTRTVRGQPMTIGAAWHAEQPHLRACPAYHFGCYATAQSTLNGYGQVTYETNRYSVPVRQAQRHLVIHAYPFKIDILDGTTVIASHSRSYKRDDEVCDPKHYLPLLEQRPGAFEHAKPMRQMRASATWPPIFEHALARLRSQEGAGIPEFVRILRLLDDYPAEDLEAALKDSLACGSVNADVVRLYLHQRHQPGIPILPLDLTAAATDHPHLHRLQEIGQRQQAVSASARTYEQLLVQMQSCPTQSELAPVLEHLEHPQVQGEPHGR